jgi:hypothetical protein
MLTGGALRPRFCWQGRVLAVSACGGGRLLRGAVCAVGWHRAVPHIWALCLNALKASAYKFWLARKGCTTRFCWERCDGVLQGALPLSRVWMTNLAPSRVLSGPESVEAHACGCGQLNATKLRHLGVPAGCSIGLSTVGLRGARHAAAEPSSAGAGLDRRVCILQTCGPVCQGCPGQGCAVGPGEYASSPHGQLCARTHRRQLKAHVSRLACSARLCADPRRAL